jgi:hypothetical protein
MKFFFICLIATSSLTMAGCGVSKTRAELLQDLVNAEQAVVAAQKNARDTEVISKAQTTYDAAYLAYNPDFAQLHNLAIQAPSPRR